MSSGVAAKSPSSSDDVNHVVADWSRLPSDILFIISSLLQKNSDYVSFLLVCRSWRSCSPSPRPPPPLLLFAHPSPDDSSRYHKTRSPLSQCSGPLFLFTPSPAAGHNHRHLPFPDSAHSAFCGSAYGFLVLRKKLQRTSGPPFAISLLNPFTHRRLSLPSLPSPWPPRKIVPSFSPSSSFVAAVAIIPLASPLFFHIRGENSWRRLPLLRIFLDAIFHADNGRMYAVDDAGSLYFYNVSTRSPTLFYWIDNPALSPPPSLPHPLPLPLTQPSSNPLENMKHYVVPLEGAVFVVVRHYRQARYHETCGFEAFEVNDCGDGMFEFIRVTDLRKMSIFLGNNASFSLCVHRFPGYRANCIYFTDDSVSRFPEDKEEECGVYDMQTGEIEPLRFGCLAVPPAVWFLTVP